MTRRRLAGIGLEFVVGILLVTSVLAGVVLLAADGQTSGQLEQYAMDTAAVLADPAVAEAPEKQTQVIETLPDDVGYYIVTPEQTLGAPPPTHADTVTTTRAHPTGPIRVTVWRR